MKLSILILIEDCSSSSNSMNFYNLHMKKSMYVYMFNSFMCFLQLQNGRTISNIFQGLEEFTSTTVSRNPIAESHAEVSGL